MLPNEGNLKEAHPPNRNQSIDIWFTKESLTIWSAQGSNMGLGHFWANRLSWGHGCNAERSSWSFSVFRKIQLSWMVQLWRCYLALTLSQGRETVDCVIRGEYALPIVTAVFCWPSLTPHISWASVPGLRSFPTPRPATDTLRMWCTMLSSRVINDFIVTGTLCSLGCFCIRLGCIFL